MRPARRIVAGGVVTGTLTFATPTSSATATEAANYLFAAPMPNHGFNVANSGTELFEECEIRA
jgi:hypothetical protein